MDLMGRSVISPWFCVCPAYQMKCCMDLAMECSDSPGPQVTIVHLGDLRTLLTTALLHFAVMRFPLSFQTAAKLVCTLDRSYGHQDGLATQGESCWLRIAT